MGGGIDIRLACRPQDVEGRPVEGRSALGARQARSARVCVCVCVCVCVGCVCEHYKDRACAVHTGGTAWTPPKLLRIPIWVGPWVPPNTCELINLGALGAP